MPSLKPKPKLKPNHGTDMDIVVMDTVDIVLMDTDIVVDIGDKPSSPFYQNQLETIL